MDWLKAGLWEIRQSSALRWFGFLLALSHLITFFFWMSDGHSPLVYYADPTPMCWSFLLDCQSLRFLSLGQFTLIYYTYPIIAILAALMFLSVRTYNLAWFCLTLTLTLKCLLYFQDYSLSGKAHYLLFVTHITYLFIPQKKTILKYLLLSFFVVSGFLKLNGDWMSGLWLKRHTDLHLKVCEWIAALSVIAELILPWLLVSRKSQNLVISFFTLMAYSIFYWSIAGTIDPVVHVLFLLYYPLYYFEQRRIEMEYIYQSYIRPEASQAWIFIVLVVFWCLQALPLLKNINPAIAQVSENLTLEGYLAVEDCKQITFAVFEKEIREIKIKQPKERLEKLRCDPFVGFLDVKTLCHQLKNEAGFLNIASSFLARRLVDKNFKRIFETDDICHQKVNFYNLGKSGWNKKTAD